MSDKPEDHLSFLDKIPADSAITRRRTRRHRQEFNTGLEEVTASQAARATGSKSMAGQYKRYTVYLAPEVIERFKRMSKDIGLSDAEAARWVFQYVLEEYANGLRPETEEVVIRRRLKRP